MATNSPALGKPTEAAPMTKEEKRVVFASSLGTIFESFQFNPTSTAKFTTPCDVAKA